MIEASASAATLKSSLQAGDKVVLEFGAKYLHSEEDLELERHLGSRELKTRAARFGVGSGGITDAKLEKKLGR